MNAMLIEIKTLLQFNSKIIESLKKDFYLLNINLAETSKKLDDIINRKGGRK
jgi:hypothetical protein